MHNRTSRKALNIHYSAAQALYKSLPWLVRSSINAALDDMRSKSYNTLLITRMKCAGALRTPYGKRVYSNKPQRVVTAVFDIEEGSIGTYQNPDSRSFAWSTEDWPISSKIWLISGRGYLSGMVTELRPLKSATVRYTFFLCGLGTANNGEAQGLLLWHCNPKVTFCLSSSLRCSST